MVATPWPDQFVDIGGLRTRFWQVGAGEAVILIHGLGGSVEQWSANVDVLSRTYRVFCLDMIGCGKTDKPASSDYSIESLARFMDLFITAKGIETFSLVGLSMGGGVCLRYALDYPAKVTNLILVGSAALGPRMALVFRILALPFMERILSLVSRRRFASFVRTMVYDRTVITDEIVDFYYHNIYEPDARRAFIRTLRANCGLWRLRKEVRDGVISRLWRLKAPTLIIWGRQDKHMPVANAYEAMKKIPKAWLIFIDKCAHNPQFEHYDEFNGVVTAFLSGHTPSLDLPPDTRT